MMSPETNRMVASALTEGLLEEELAAAAGTGGDRTAGGRGGERDTKAAAAASSSIKNGRPNAVYLPWRTFFDGMYVCMYVQ